MSYLIPYAASGFALLTAIFIVFFLDQRSYAKKYKGQIAVLEEDLYNWKRAAEGANNYPASKWKEIAMHHAKQHSGTRAHFEREHKYLRELIDVLNQKLEVRDLEFRYLVVHLWGEPPLDRSMQNVMDLIDELRMQPYELLHTNIATNRQMKRFAEDAANVRGELRELAKKYEDTLIDMQKARGYLATLVNEEWSVYLAKDVTPTEPAVFEVRTVKGSVLGSGLNPEEAIENAKNFDPKSKSCPA